MPATYTDFSAISTDIFAKCLRYRNVYEENTDFLKTIQIHTEYKKKYRCYTDSKNTDENAATLPINGAEDEEKQRKITSARNPLCCCTFDVLFSLYFSHSHSFIFKLYNFRIHQNIDFFLPNILYPLWM